MIDTMTRAVYSYVDQMPHNVLDSALKSGIYSFALNSAFSGSFEVGAVIGGIAATVSLVHALTTPLFKRMVGGDVVQWPQRACHLLVNLALTQVAVNAVTALRVNLISSAALIIGVSFLFSGTQETNLNRGGLYIFI
ncbi:hypothetical protein PNK_1228 [Candidatus Protochlamydia naegleriophila]|uniref:Uncharacterized protein n=1 Tax=Candidatus Protochlamydia naegleriophila TaxID=389348 RepID=A0A0U5JCM4_9BACT|nr:hypothetical protein [Candidatus Protochlamydia naegleriophila]CUI16845.1 hypothetical protein PNK_1228 [Candidatus Protochlamydia naegleriophila]